MQLPPVDHERLGLDPSGRQAFRLFPRQDTQADPGGLAADGLEAFHVAADDAATEVGLVDAIDRRSRSVGNICTRSRGKKR